MTDKSESEDTPSPVSTAETKRMGFDIFNIGFGVYGMAQYARAGAVSSMAFSGIDLGLTGIVASVLDFCYAWDQYKLKVVRENCSKCFDAKLNSPALNKPTELPDNGYYTNTHFKKFGYMGLFIRLTSSSFLLGTSLQELYASAAGAPAWGLVPIAYAVKSAVDLVGALVTFIDTKNKVITNEPDEVAEKNLFAKATAFVGWTLLAYGNPVGFVFLLMTVIPVFLRKLCYAMADAKHDIQQYSCYSR